MKTFSAAQGLCVFTLVICSGVLLDCGTGGGKQPATSGAVKLTQITIAPSDPRLAKGTSTRLTATGIYSNGTKQNLTATVAWQTSESKVVTINDRGEVNGVGEGVAQVSASYQGVTGNTSVAVGAASLVKITVSPNSSSLPLGESLQLTATGSFSDGSSQNLTNSVTWNSSATMAIVTPSGSVTAKTVGTATISATIRSVTGHASVTVGSAALVGITVTPNPSSLPLGESEQFTATGNFSDGSVQTMTTSVTWSSSGPIASVNSSGSATAAGVGNATITATSGSVSGSASLAVTPPVVVSVSVVPVTLSLVLESSGQLQATANMSDGSTQNITTTATWTLTPTAVASVSSAGTVLAQQVGTATITATDSGVAGTANLTVIPLLTVSYFNLQNSLQSGIDGTMRLTNPGVSGGDLCAMIYVFDSNQELNECCGCPVSDSGLLTLSLINDLTANTLTGKQPAAGFIEMVPSNLGSGGQCNAGSPSPNGVILGWETNVQPSAGGFQLTESKMGLIPLSSSEAEVLATECTMAQQLGSGQGICTCGTGD